MNRTFGLIKWRSSTFLQRHVQVQNKWRAAKRDSNNY